MLRLLAPQFEHRLFLSATPHNGHTRCFSGLLEILDPVRFSQTDQFREAERGRLQQVVIRRLKREINARTTPPKFCKRLAPQALVLNLQPQEIALTAAFDTFRKAIHTLIVDERSTRRRTGTFAVEILGKRLLSCAVAFADSWRRCKQGLAENATAADAEVQAEIEDAVAFANASPPPDPADAPPPTGELGGRAKRRIAGGEVVPADRIVKASGFKKGQHYHIDDGSVR